jgi:hypothetical protein
VTSIEPAFGSLFVSRTVTIHGTNLDSASVVLGGNFQLVEQSSSVHVVVQLDSGTAAGAVPVLVSSSVYGDTTTTWEYAEGASCDLVSDSGPV